MSAPPATPTPDPAATVDADKYRRLLHRVLDVGATLLDRIEQQSDPATPLPPGMPRPTLADLTAAHERVARAIRRTILLAQRLGQPGAGSARTAARKRIVRDVQSAIQRKATGKQADALVRELHERLDAPDMDDDIGTMTVEQVITEICRDLGLFNPPGTPTWQRRTPDDIAALCALAAQPSRPRPPASPPRPLPPGRGERPPCHEARRSHSPPIRAPA